MAMSATGQPFILGKQNTADQASKLIRHGAGNALNLEVQDGQPPMKVDSDAKVANLNADQLDGKSDTDFAAAYKSTVVLSPVGTDTQNGTALLDALSGITGASATNPYLLHLEPGTYDLGTGSLQMKEHVDIEGSGELNTTINTTISSGVAVSEGAPLDEFPGTVQGANNAELRLLTVSITGTSLCNAAAISNISASPPLTYVTAEATGGGGRSFNNGVINLDSNPNMTNVTATASGGGGNFGVYNDQSSSTIRERTLNGSAYSLFQEGGTTKVAATQLNGFVNEGVICAGVYDENYTFYASTCP